MRICSFNPGATEIAFSLGLEDSLFGVSHECDYPAAARGKPRVVRSVFDEAEQLSSAQIDRIVSERVAQGLGIYEIDQQVLQDAAPDLLLTQAICEV